MKSVSLVTLANVYEATINCEPGCMVAVPSGAEKAYPNAAILEAESQEKE